MTARRVSDRTETLKLLETPETFGPDSKLTARPIALNCCRSYECRLSLQFAPSWSVHPAPHNSLALEHGRPALPEANSQQIGSIASVSGSLGKIPCKLHALQASGPRGFCAKQTPPSVGQTQWAGWAVLTFSASSNHATYCLVSPVLLLAARRRSLHDPGGPPTQAMQ